MNFLNTLRPDARSGSTQRDETDAGFTLVELLVVMVILVLLAGVVGPRVVGYLGTSKTKIARLQIEGFASTLELFRVDVGRYPTSAEGLKALIEKPTAASVWNGPYLKKSEVPVDPWGKPYIYLSPGQHGPFDLSSLGADGALGGEGENADIRSWE